MKKLEADKKADLEADKIVPEDRDEQPTMMEPLLISQTSPRRAELSDLALELAQKSTGLSRSLPPQTTSALATLVRSMNCYYSNLIEGHDTHPIDIERALSNDYSADPQKRALQLEARAHIETQQWIDNNGLAEKSTSEQSILGVHQYFCERLPEELLWVENPDTGERIKLVPGQYRQRDVKVGRHIPVSPGALPRFMKRFQEAYDNLGRVDTIIASATAHHRLLWVHPFLDGNGRVARLMSYAILRDAINTGGIWSVARGLARQEKLYKTKLANCDAPRRGDRDGRGNLSESSLADLTAFFLESCIDQVEFMEELIQPQHLRQRILLWIEETIRLGKLPAGSDLVLDALIYRGELPRSDIPALLGSSDRHARRITSALLGEGVLTSSSNRAPFQLAFPARLAGRWMPGLFPENN